MHRVLRLFFALPLLCAFFFATGAGAADRPVTDVPGSGAKPPVVGQRMAIPGFKTLDGKTITAADLKGKVVVLEYWASWCPFCQNQIPYFEKLYRARAGDGLVVIGLNIENNVAKAKGFVDSRHLTFPVVMTNPAIDQQLRRPRGLPVTYVIGRDGKLARIDTGELFEEDVADIGDLVKPAGK